jgi:hypothetical protein
MFWLVGERRLLTHSTAFWRAMRCAWVLKIRLKKEVDEIIQIKSISSTHRRTLITNIYAPLVHFLYLQTQIIKAILGFQGLVPLRSAPLDVPPDWRRLLIISRRYMGTIPSLRTSYIGIYKPYHTYMILLIFRVYICKSLYVALRTCNFLCSYFILCEREKHKRHNFDD